MKPRPRWLRPALATVALVVAAIAYSAWTALSLRSHLEAANAEAHALRSAVLAQDRVAAQHSFDAMASDFRVARDRASSPAWWAAEHLPVVGDDARAVGTVAHVGAQVAGGPLRQFLTTGDWALLERLPPHHGRVDMHAVEALAPGVQRLATSFEHGSRQLHAVAARHLTGLVAPSFIAARRQLAEVARALGAADRAFGVLPGMLGADGPRTWLLAFDNNAEIRATGGMPGAIALIRADNGRISMVRQTTAASFPQLRRPILPLRKAERAIYDVQPGVFFQDANFTPEFPRTAALWRARWLQRFGGRVDGVASVDTVTLSYLLRATGPVTAHGVQLTPANASQQLLHDVYERWPDNAAQDAFFRDVARTMFTKLTSGVRSAPELAAALAQGVREGRVYVHSFHQGTQAVLNATPIAGNLDFGAGSRPQLGIYLNDATGSKMSWYLRTHVAVTSQRCVAGRQALEGTITFWSTAPKDASLLPAAITGGGAYGTAPGHQLVIGRIYGPAAGSLSDFRFGSDPVPVPTVNDRGRPVATTVVDLAPRQSTRMTWRMTTGKGQNGALLLTQSPGITPRPARLPIRSSCR